MYSNGGWLALHEIENNTIVDPCCFTVQWSVLDMYVGDASYEMIACRMHDERGPVTWPFLDLFLHYLELGGRGSVKGGGSRMIV
eukprot:2806420-Amphidinium_carterae.1